MEACRLKGIKSHVPGIVGLECLEILEKDIEQRVKRNVIETEHQRALDASKTRRSLPKKTFTKTFKSSVMTHMQRTDYQKKKKMTRKMP